MTETLFKIIESWAKTEGVAHTTNEILNWVEDLNQSTEVNIRRISLSESSSWYYDSSSGDIRNRNGSFFTIGGIQTLLSGEVIDEQPIIIQNEIGYLGFICKEIHGVLHFLIQAKIEPGNINKIQLSPTIQATRSNFTQKHGGKRPDYLDYFINTARYEIIIDQIQSEQSSRFYKKRNRNIIIRVEEDIQLTTNHRWLTLGQIKKLMKYDNLVNMDTRTVISCIPFSFGEFDETKNDCIHDLFNDKYLYKSIFTVGRENILPKMYHYINNQKMFNNSETKLVSLASLSSWEMTNTDFLCRTPHDFKVIFCDISIEGREVKNWSQPLFESMGIATFGLICTIKEGVKKFLVKAKSEIGSFDFLEIGPSVQLESSPRETNDNFVTRLFWDRYSKQQRILHNVLLSEEGGRFFHEQNLNVILEVEEEILHDLPEGYFLLDYKTLNYLVQINNCLNIQLRNLLSLLEV